MIRKQIEIFHGTIVLIYDAASRQILVRKLLNRYEGERHPRATPRTT
jgi:hypothetical protein